MASWFTVERLDEDTWVVSEYRHWEHTHCYLLLGRERALLIDTGLGVAPLAPVVRELTGLPVNDLRQVHNPQPYPCPLGPYRRAGRIPGAAGPRIGGSLAVWLFPCAHFCGTIKFDLAAP